MSFGLFEPLLTNRSTLACRKPTPNKVEPLRQIILKATLLQRQIFVGADFVEIMRCKRCLVFHNFVERREALL